MSRNIRLTVAFAALLLSAAYVLPLWRIGLIAPQYPEGLGMLIRVNAIEGFKEGDLQSINGLNHYIGMKTIEPDAIPELRLMPMILGVLIVTGLGVAALGKRGPFIAWSAALATVLVAGLADYWKWGYEYGHDLSPTAIIKIPGMTYQPPLIGSKQLLNFTATSWPAAGGWILIAAAVLVGVALVLTLRRRRVATAATAVALAAAACAGPGTKPIMLHEDSCDYCRMTIVDARYGGEAVTTTGRVYKFDAIECLAGWVRKAPPGTVRGIYVIDLQHPGTFVAADSAGFLTGVLIGGPMGKGTVAFANPAAAERQRAMLGGRAARWADILADTAAPAVLGATDIIVDERGPIRTVAQALAMAKPGDRIVVRPGTYREPTIVVRTGRLIIEGHGWPVIDGEGKRSVMIVEADDVTIRGLVITRTGASNLDDRAALRVRNARDCLIEHNRLRDNLFGVYLERSIGCIVRDNDVAASGRSQTTSGNGIHLWNSPNTRVERNRVTGHRDGIYFEFSPHGVTRDNVSEYNQRYGLHFMFSDSCAYERNTFRDNRSGVAVMYSRGITIRGNAFERANGSAAYGLLLKDLLGGEIAGNRFIGNSTGLYLEGSSRLTVRDNDFRQNGWAARVLAGAEGNHFTGNLFAGNAFDVTTNSRSSNSSFDGNWWDAYRGYDLDRDGVGDVPFRPVRLFALVVEQHPEALALLRSPFVTMLDAAERVLPVLTPAALADARPLMRPPR